MDFEGIIPETASLSQLETSIPPSQPEGKLQKHEVEVISPKEGDHVWKTGLRELVEKIKKPIDKEEDKIAVTAQLYGVLTTMNKSHVSEKWLEKTTRIFQKSMEILPKEVVQLILEVTPNDVLKKLDGETVYTLITQKGDAFYNAIKSLPENNVRTLFNRLLHSLQLTPPKGEKDRQLFQEVLRNGPRELFQNLDPMTARFLLEEYKIDEKLIDKDKGEKSDIGEIDKTRGRIHEYPLGKDQTKKDPIGPILQEIIQKDSVPQKKGLEYFYTLFSDWQTLRHPSRQKNWPQKIDDYFIDSFTALLDKKAMTDQECAEAFYVMRVNINPPFPRQKLDDLLSRASDSIIRIILSDFGQAGALSSKETKEFFSLKDDYVQSFYKNENPTPEEVFQFRENRRRLLKEVGPKVFFMPNEIDSVDKKRAPLQLQTLSSLLLEAENIASLSNLVDEKAKITEEEAAKILYENFAVGVSAEKVNNLLTATNIDRFTKLHHKVAEFILNTNDMQEIDRERVAQKKEPLSPKLREIVKAAAREQEPENKEFRATFLACKNTLSDTFSEKWNSFIMNDFISSFFKNKSTMKDDELDTAYAIICKELQQYLPLLQKDLKIEFLKTLPNNGLEILVPVSSIAIVKGLDPALLEKDIKIADDLYHSLDKKDRKQMDIERISKKMMPWQKQLHLVKAKINEVIFETHRTMSH